MLLFLGIGRLSFDASFRAFRSGLFRLRSQSAHPVEDDFAGLLQHLLELSRFRLSKRIVFQELEVLNGMLVDRRQNRNGIFQAQLPFLGLLNVLHHETSVLLQVRDVELFREHGALVAVLHREVLEDGELRPLGNPFGADLGNVVVRALIRSGDGRSGIADEVAATLLVKAGGQLAKLAILVLAGGGGTGTDRTNGFQLANVQFVKRLKRDAFVLQVLMQFRDQVSTGQRFRIAFALNPLHHLPEQLFKLVQKQDEVRHCHARRLRDAGGNLLLRHFAAIRQRAAGRVGVRLLADDVAHLPDDNQSRFGQGDVLALHNLRAGVKHRVGTVIGELLPPEVRHGARTDDHRRPQGGGVNRQAIHAVVRLNRSEDALALSANLVELALVSDRVSKKRNGIRHALELFLLDS